MEHRFRSLERHLRAVLTPIAVDNPAVPVHFYAHAFDDDSNFLYEDSESLGNINYAIDLTTLDPANPVTLRVNSVGGSGSFGLDIEIRYRPRARESPRIVQSLATSIAGS